MNAGPVLDRTEYTRSVIRMYLSLPETPQRAARSDWILANQLFDRRIEVETVRHALLLATVRRLGRPPEMPRLALIRSLHYFLPAVDELREQPLPAGYPEYLERKIELLTHTNDVSGSDPALDRKSTFSRDR